MSVRLNKIVGRGPMPGDEKAVESVMRVFIAGSSIPLTDGHQKMIEAQAKKAAATRKVRTSSSNGKVRTTKRVTVAVACKPPPKAA